MDTRKRYNLEADIIELVKEITEAEYTLEWLTSPEYDADSDNDREYRAGDIEDAENTIARDMRELRTKVERFNRFYLMEGTPPYTVEDRVCHQCETIVAKCDLEDWLCPDCYDDKLRYKANP